MLFLGSEPDCARDVTFVNEEPSASALPLREEEVTLEVVTPHKSLTSGFPHAMTNTMGLSAHCDQLVQSQD